MRDYRAVLLRKPHHVDHARGLAFEMCRHAEHMADGHDTGAAYAGHHDRPRRIKLGQHRLGQHRENRAIGRKLGRLQPLDHLRAFDGHEARAEALDAL